MNGASTIQAQGAAPRFLPWLGVALLAGSWLPGLGYYQPASSAVWMMLLLAGTLLLCGAPVRAPGRLQTAVAILLMLPMLGLAPWPYKASPVLIVIGAGVLALAPPRRWVRNLAGAALAAGVVLLAQ
jgi:hypothetical protein